MQLFATMVRRFACPALGLVVAALLLGAPGLAAQDATPVATVPVNSSLTIRKHACPADFDQDYAACRGRPQAGVSFSIFTAGQDNGVGGTTDADGVVAFALDPFVPGNVNVVEQVPAGFQLESVACEKAPGIAAEYIYTDTGITLVGLEAGAAIVCDWYDVAASPDPDPTATPLPADPTPASGPRATDTPTGGVGRLPNTGAGIVDHRGVATAVLVVTTLAVLTILGWLLLPRRRHR